MPPAVERADCPGASEQLAAALITAGLAEPQHLTAETPTDDFVRDALERWARGLLTHAELHGSVSVECEVGGDREAGAPRLSLSLHTHHYFEWHAGPYLNDLAGRCPAAARTLLKVIEGTLTWEVYGPWRAKEELEYLAEMEDELRDEEDDGAAEGEGTEPAEAKPATSFQAILGAEPLPQSRILSGLRPHVSADVFATVSALLQAERSRERIRTWQAKLSDEADGTVPSLYCLFETHGDSTTAAFDSEAQGWTDGLGPNYDFVGHALDAGAVRTVFGAMARTLKVLDLLHTLRSLTIPDDPESAEA